MKKNALFIGVLCMGLLSCHKDTGSSHGPRLSRYVLNRGDSVVYDLQYDVNGLVTKFTFTGNGFGPNLDIQTTRLFRNRAGVITEMIDAWPDADSALNPSDTTIVYHDGDGRYTGMITTHYRDAYQQPIDRRDSTVFTYNSDGRISQQQLYIRDASVSPDYAQNQARYYSYDQQGNLLTDSTVAIGGTHGVPQWVYHYTYDNHPNPLPMGNDALLLMDRDWIGMPHINAWCSKNNVISAQALDIQDPISNFSMQRTLSYSSSGLPTGSSDEWFITFQAQQDASVTRYYY